MRIFLTLIFFMLLLDAKEYRVGVLFWSENIPGQVAMKKGVELEIEKINKQAIENNTSVIIPYYYIAGDGVEGIQNQIEQFYKLIEMDVDAIIVQPTDNAALKKPLLEANSKNIPVIAYDQYIRGGKLESFITSDNYQAGYLAGEYLASFFNRKINLVLVDYPHVSSTVQRVEGFLQALDDYGQKYSVVGSYKAVEPKSGKEAAMSILEELNDSRVDAIFCVNDGAGYTVASELQKANFDAVIATVDGQPESVEMIKNNQNIIISSAQFCGEMGRLVAQKTYKVLEGGTINEMILIPTYPVTKDSLEYYNGWLGEPPKSFKKTWKSYTPLWKYRLKVE